MLKINDFLQKKQGFNTRDNMCKERGGAIIWIFLMIAIFAALNYAVSKGSRGGAAQISQEQARMAATDILDYSRTIKNAVQTLQINGCADTEVSFDQAVVSGYSNPNSPSDESCHVFKTNGGGLNYQTPDKDWLDGSKSALTHYGTQYTSSNIWLTGLGINGSGSPCAGATGDCRELMTGIPFIKKSICMTINKKLGWGTDSKGTPYKDSGFSYAHFTHIPFAGVYPPVAGNEMGTATPTSYSNIMTGCIESTASHPADTYSFFQVLIVR